MNRDFNLPPWALLFTGVFGMMTLPNYMLNAYIQEQIKQQKLQSSPERKRYKTIVGIEDVSDGKL